MAHCNKTLFEILEERLELSKDKMPYTDWEEAQKQAEISMIESIIDEYLEG